MDVHSFWKCVKFKILKNVPDVDLNHNFSFEMEREEWVKYFCDPRRVVLTQEGENKNRTCVY